MQQMIRTPGRHSHDLQFSPYFANRLAVATSQFYGLAGSGALYIINLRNDHGEPQSQIVSEHKWNDSLFSLAWSEVNENIVCCGAGDGSVVVYNIHQAKAPLTTVKLHTREVSALNWFQNRINGHLFATGSWDHSIKLWDCQSLKCLTDMPNAHTALVYEVAPSPLTPGLFSSVSGDGFLKLWNINSPKQPVGQFKSHDSEVLTVDWCKYDQHILATGGTDGLTKIWDLRNPITPINTLTGHNFAVRRVKFSPFHKSTLVTSSYDFSVKVWDCFGHSHPSQSLDHHTEFVCGLDMNSHIPGQLASASWDETVWVREWTTPPAPP